MKRLVLLLAAVGALGVQYALPTKPCTYRGKKRSLLWTQEAFKRYRPQVAWLEKRWIDAGCLEHYVIRPFIGEAGQASIKVIRDIDNGHCIGLLCRRGSPAFIPDTFDERCVAVHFTHERADGLTVWNGTVAVVGTVEIDGKQYYNVIPWTGTTTRASAEPFVEALESGFILRNWRKVERSAEWQGKRVSYHRYEFTEVP